MKNIKRTLSLGFIFLTSIATLHAIPNQVGGGQFINPAGMRFEKFAAEAQTWKSNAKLPGNWENWNDPNNKDSKILVYHLNMKADVFGIQASEVTAQVKNDQVIQFKIVFNKKNSQSASLIDQVISNIRSFTGETGTKDTKSFDYKKVKIQVKSGSNDSILVTITPLAKAVASR